MTSFLSIENALRNITEDDEKYRQTAGMFDRILSDPDSNPEEKAKKIAAVIKDGNEAEL